MEASIQAYAKKMLANFKDYEFFTGESMDPDGMVVLMNYREDGITPYMIFWKDGLREVSFSLGDGSICPQLTGVICFWSYRSRSKCHHALQKVIPVSGGLCTRQYRYYLCMEALVAVIHIHDHLRYRSPQSGPAV